MSSRMHIAPEAVLRSYFRAKDENRPHLLAGVFAPDALLEVRNNSGTVAFPAVTMGREAIAEVLVRAFNKTYEDIYSFYMARPADTAHVFSCRWLVCMAVKDGRSVRVGCGRYDWGFEPEPSGLAASLRITIDTMLVLPEDTHPLVLPWLLRLSYPWSSPAEVAAAPTPVAALDTIVQYLGRSDIDA